MVKEYIIYSNFDIYSEENRQDSARNLLDAAERSGELVKAVDNFGRTVLLPEKECMDYLDSSGRLDRECEELDALWFSAERDALSLLDCGKGIVAIADIGKWNGRFSGFKEIKSLPDVLFSSEEFEKVYVDSNGDLRKTVSHHDGSNFILYRYWKDSATERQKARFLEKCLDGSLRPSDISRYTRRAGAEIAEHYGLKIRSSRRSGGGE